MCLMPHRIVHKLAQETRKEMASEEYQKDLEKIRAATAARKTGENVSLNDLEAPPPKCPFWAIILYRTVLFLLWLAIIFTLSTRLIMWGATPGSFIMLIFNAPFVYLIWATAKGKLDFKCMKEPPAQEPQPEPQDPAPEPEPESSVHVVKPVKLAQPKQSEPPKKSRRPSLKLAPALLILAVGCLGAFFLGRWSVTSRELSFNESVQTIAVLAQSANIPEDNPIIQEASRLSDKEAYVHGTKTEELTEQLDDLTMELRGAKAKAGILEYEKTALEEELSSLKSDLKDLEFYKENAVIVPVGDSNFHWLRCHEVSGKSFNIYNVEAAKAYGYTPCSNCFGFFGPDIFPKPTVSEAFEKLKELAESGKNKES